jgi:hypothetical protein
MNDNETYDPTWRDDAELDALLLAAKITALADLDGALDIPEGHRAIRAEDLPSARSPPDSPAMAALFGSAAVVTATPGRHGRSGWRWQTGMPRAAVATSALGSDRSRRAGHSRRFPSGRCAAADTMLRVPPCLSSGGQENERTVMGNAAIGEELAGIDELDELYELNASESDDDDEYDDDEYDDDEYDEEGDEDEENIEDEDDEDEDDDDEEFE